ncbi:MAG: glycosyltransferase [Bacillus sp. (in: Bacteria)]|nr:glycosyltransferase [Bacillus sp. (in: firmicutes)]
MEKYKASVVLSAYNAMERLQLTLAAYQYQTFPKDMFEVIIVDDGSTDNTCEMVSKLDTSYPLKYIRLKENNGRATARNRGIEAASGEIIILSDSDMLPEQEFITKHVSHHEKIHNTFLCGSFWNEIYTQEFEGLKKKRVRKAKNKKSVTMVLPSLSPHKKLELLYVENNIFEYTAKKRFSDYYENFPKKFGSNLQNFLFPWLYFIVMNVSVKKEHLTAEGLFDENFTGWGAEDEEMGYRLYHSGIRGYVDINIKNYHQEHSRTKKREKVESYFNKLYFLRKHPNLDAILCYLPIPMNREDKNLALQEYHRLRSLGSLSNQFEKELIHLFFQEFQGGNVTLSKTFIKEYNQIKRLDIAPTLCKSMKSALQKVKYTH